MYCKACQIHRINAPNTRNMLKVSYSFFKKEIPSYDEKGLLLQNTFLEKDCLLEY